MRELLIADAQAALGFVREQATHVEAGVNMMVYGDIQYASLIPVDTSAHPFTQSVLYVSGDSYGRANWINGNADDIPMVGSEMAQHQTPVYTAGIGYGYGWEEVNVAMMMGHNLPNDGAMAARRAYEEMVDDVALQGDMRKGFSGLFNFPGVTIGAATNGDWLNANTTEDQILADINDALFDQAEDTLYTAPADTLLLPKRHLNRLATKKLSDSGGKTLLSFIRENNTYTAMTGNPLLIRTVRGLETKGAGGTPRMVTYRRSPDVLKLHIPMPHRFLPAQQAGTLSWKIPGVFRMGGLDIRRKKEIRYTDGI